MATMNNAQIIFNESLELMKEGIISGTGRTIQVTVNENGQNVTKTIEEPEEIHTFKDWKKRGFVVMKGQKAIASFMIWNFHENKTTSEDEDPAPSLMKNGYYYMKKAAFFKRSQVKSLTDPDPEPTKGPEPEKATEAPATKKASRKPGKPAPDKALAYIEKQAAKNPATANMCGTYEGVTYAANSCMLMITTEAVSNREYMEHEKSFHTSVMDSGKKGAINEAAFTLTAADIKNGIKEAKNGRRGAKVVYTTAEGITLRAEYLYYAILATGATAYKYNMKKSPVIFESENTSFLICPINVKQEMQPGFSVIG